jgi:FAD dependent oxidoreductase
MVYYTEPAHQLPVTRDVDVIVVGGGPAGLAAAIASARNGARTVLIEQFGYLGGTATASLMACINGFRNQSPIDPDKGAPQVVRGIAQEIVLDLKRLNGLAKSPYPQKAYPTEPGQLEYSYAIDTEKFKYLTLKLCVDAGVDVLFHTYFCQSIVEGDAIRGVIIENKSGRQAMMAKVIIDASGDADVATRAGAPFWHTKHQEANRMVDQLMYRIEFGQTRPKTGFSCDFGSNAVVWGPAAKPINAADGDELSKAEIDARLRVYDDFAAKQSQYPDLADARVVETPPLIGIRQTRFVEGEYKLTAEDAINGARFDDVIAISPCAIIHSYGYRRYLAHDGYDIPYRCLVPKKIDNLLIAGRCISSAQEPYESHRAMVNMIAVGEAAGTAAALCSKGGVKPRALNVRQLQNTLINQGAELRREAR